jgi:hypothetical protein
MAWTSLPGRFGHTFDFPSCSYLSLSFFLEVVTQAIIELAQHRVWVLWAGAMALAALYCLC